MDDLIQEVLLKCGGIDGLHAQILAPRIVESSLETDGQFDLVCLCLGRIDPAWEFKQPPNVIVDGLNKVCFFFFFSFGD